MGNLVQEVCCLELVYATDKVKDQCTNTKSARKLFGGNELLTISLFARINGLKQANTIKDIIVQPAYHFHKLINKKGKDFEGYFAIDVKTRKERWRIILELLDDNKAPYENYNIDKIASYVRVVRIMEVSEHYE